MIKSAESIPRFFMWLKLNGMYFSLQVITVQIAGHYGMIALKNAGRRMHMAVIGIDLGTTNSLCSIFREGKVELIPNAFGEFLTPSVVSIGEDGEVFVGKIAKEMLITKPSCTFAEFKRNMGTDYCYTVGDKSYRAEELSAFLLRRLKEDAEHYLGEEVTEAIISVPAYFNDDKRCATKNAGHLAGLKVERLVNEPSAVALKHHLESEKMETFIVFDLGGGTLDVSLVDAFDNMVEIRAVAGDNYLGGKDFNEMIAEDFYRKEGLDRNAFSHEEQGIILKEAELLKRELSEQNEVERIFLLQEKEYRMHLSNQELIHICRDLFKRMSVPLKKVINDSEIDLEEIDRIILVGGSSKMPVVRQYLKSLTQIDVIADKRPDESIAIGVGMAAAIKERTGEIKDYILADICPFSIGVEIYDGTFSTIIERNDTLPCRKIRDYVTARDNQTEMEFRIYQGENMRAEENLFLGTLKISGLPPAPAKVVGARVTFLYDINGILDVQIDSSAQSVHKVFMNKKMGLSEEELQKHLEELQNMSIHPLGKEKDRLLIERAERLYMESNLRVREQIALLIRHFKDTLTYEKPRKAREEYVSISLYLDAVEKNKLEFGAFDESFFQEQETMKDREDEEDGLQ